MTTRRRFLLAAAAALPALALAPVAARAQNADALRSSGAAGERYDGYMEAREASARAAVDKINAQRRKVYAKRAAQEGVPAEQVGRVFAQQIIGKAPAGTWIRMENGQWTQK